MRVQRHELCPASYNGACGGRVPGRGAVGEGRSYRQDGKNDEQESPDGPV